MGNVMGNVRVNETHGLCVGPSDLASISFTADQLAQSHTGIYIPVIHTAGSVISNRPDALFSEPRFDRFDVVCSVLDIARLDSRYGDETFLSLWLTTKATHRLKKTSGQTHGAVADRDPTARIVKAVRTGIFRIRGREPAGIRVNP